MSPHIFKTDLAWILRPPTVTWDSKGLGAQLDHKAIVNIISYADDIRLVAKDKAELRRMLDALIRRLQSHGYDPKGEEIEWMTSCTQGRAHDLKVAEFCIPPLLKGANMRRLGVWMQTGNNHGAHWSLRRPKIMGKMAAEGNILQSTQMER